MARRYGDPGSPRYADPAGIEVWNEPNAQEFWGGCDPRFGDEVRRYARVLHAAAAGVSDSRTGVDVVTAGLHSGENDEPGKHVLVWERYLPGLFEAWESEGFGRLGRAVDAVGIHPYRADRFRGGRGLATPGKIVRNARHQLDRARAILDRWRGAAPIWVTEVGVSTSPGQPWSLRHAPERVQRRRQAEALVRVYRELRERRVRVAVVHRLVDRSAEADEESGAGVLTGPSGGGQPGGVVEPPFAPKPAYCALAAERGVPAPAACR